MAELFQTTKQNIGRHLKNIFAEGELRQDSVVKRSFTTAADGKAYRTKHYNLDTILAVGYRVRSPVATHFRQWATERLREYLVKGFTLDDERLKGRDRVADYFDELLARIREIRAVVMFLDQAEFRAQRRQDIRMRDWEAFLDKFLRDTELPVLAGAGSVTHEEAIEWAEAQYDAFSERRRLEAESEAETRYLDDLRASAKALEAKRKRPMDQGEKRASRSKRRKGRK